jgi:hypothetical protein
MDIAAAAAHAAIQRPLEVVRQRGEKKISGEKGEEGKGREGKEEGYNVVVNYRR